MYVTLFSAMYNENELFTELLYPFQGGCTPLHFAASAGSATCVERLLSTPGIDVNIKNDVDVS